MIDILDEFEKPDWVEYPPEYLEMVRCGKDQFLPWYLMNKKQITIRYSGMQRRYPDRILYPFARDDMSDDVACWEKSKPGKVVLLHDFASPGYENKYEFDNYMDWYNFVVANYFYE